MKRAMPGTLAARTRFFGQHPKMVMAAMFIVVLCGVITLVFSEPTQAPMPEVDAANTSVGSAVEPSQDWPAAITEHVSPKSAEQIKSGPVVDEYQSGASLRRFVLNALQNPSGGAALYALRVVGECDALAKLTDALSEAQPPILPDDREGDAVRRIVAFDTLKRRCAEFLPSESPQLIADLRRAASKANEPVYLANERFPDAARSSDATRRRETLSRVLVTRDPMVLDSLGVQIGLYSDEPAIGPQFRFQGHSYALRSDSDIIFAVELLPCAFGLRCDGNEGLTALNCVRGGPCYEGRFDALKNGILRDDPIRYERTMQLYRRMVRSIRDGVVEDFMK
jgi:hypothetical protein